MTQEILENEIKYHQFLYYVKSAPVISDADFDILWDKLKNEYPTSKLLEKVGNDHTDGFPQGKHLLMMGSQRKATTHDEMVSWVELNKIAGSIVIQHKLDGLSLELQYENGELLAAVTRGDGVIGDIVTSNAEKVQGVPKLLKTKNYSGGVRGEIVLFKDVFNKKYAEEYKNPRNTASGFLKNLEGTNCSDLVFIAYDKTVSSLIQTSEEETILWLQHNGFIPVHTDRLVSFSVSSFFNIVNKTIANRNNFKYGIDGLVVKQNKIDIDDREERLPKKQIAFKFPPEEKTTTLIGVEWGMTNSTLTPVALLEPVELDGSTVKRASLVNMKLIRDLDVKINDKVSICKRGDIIPKIEKVVRKSSIGEEIIPPSTCPECGFALAEDGSTRIYCPNRGCMSVIIGNISRWIGVLDIKGFGHALVSDLCRKGYVSEPADLYTMDRSSYLLTTNLKKNTLKAFSAMDSVKSLTVEQFVEGMNIEGFGRKQAEKLVANGHDTFDKILNISHDEMVSIEGFGEKVYSSFISEYKEAFARINNVLNTGKVKVETKEINSIEGVQGKSFCFTGKLLTLKRKDAESAVKNAGGLIIGVSPKLDYLVCNDLSSGSSKIKKAQNFGTKVITEKEFNEILSGK